MTDSGKLGFQQRLQQHSVSKRRALEQSVPEFFQLTRLQSRSPGTSLVQKESDTVPELEKETSGDRHVIRHLRGTGSRSLAKVLALAATVCVPHL